MSRPSKGRKSNNNNNKNDTPSTSHLSGKIKKQQMKEKREELQRRQQQQNPNANAAGRGRGNGRGQGGTRKQGHSDDDDDDDDASNDSDRNEEDRKDDNGGALPSISSLELSGSVERNALRTMFARESKEDIERRKLESRMPLNRLPQLDGTIESVNYYKEVVPCPQRPPWQAEWSAAELHANEEKYFRSYLDNIYSKYGENRLNHFEHNLNVWRQLWRVVETSDIILICMDVRMPLLQFPASLYEYVAAQLNIPVIAVFSKIDLVPRKHVEAWRDWFNQHFPKLSIVLYSTQPRSKDTPTNEHLDPLKKENEKRKQRSGIVWDQPYGLQELEQCCQRLVAQHAKKFGIESSVVERFNLRSSIEEKVEQVTSSKAKKKASKMKRNRKQSRQKESEGENVDENLEESEHDSDDDIETTEVQPQNEKNSIFISLEEKEGRSESSRLPFIRLGLVGHPNASKSSLINSLLGRNLVSVSKTPGHTKYLQTLFLNDNIRLCDCPGLVFPAIDMPRALQVLAGCFPIAQARDPYSALRILAEHLPLEKIYKLRPVPEDERDTEGDWEWNPWTIAEALAYQKGFRTRKGTLDVYRACNFLLRDALEGTIVLYFQPPK